MMKESLVIKKKDGVPWINGKDDATFVYPPP